MTLLYANTQTRKHITVVRCLENPCSLETSSLYLSSQTEERLPTSSFTVVSYYSFSQGAGNQTH
uniref:Uncharacterized protein n=1 Tax=Anguilla anguilla TaxID=7936 RepID=A0A0E9THC1_ANGAN